jgi:hypothetical protein
MDGTSRPASCVVLGGFLTCFLQRNLQLEPLVVVVVVEVEVEVVVVVVVEVQPVVVVAVQSVAVVVVQPLALLRKLTAATTPKATISCTGTKPDASSQPLPSPHVFNLVCRAVPANPTICRPMRPTACMTQCIFALYSCVKRECRSKPTALTRFPALHALCLVFLRSDTWMH